MGSESPVLFHWNVTSDLTLPLKSLSILSQSKLHVNPPIKREFVEDSFAQAVLLQSI